MLTRLFFVIFFPTQIPIKTKTTHPVEDKKITFTDYAHFHTRVITGAFALLCVVEPGENSCQSR